jgi:hypothetical protein
MSRGIGGAILARAGVPEVPRPAPQLTRERSSGRREAGPRPLPAKTSEQRGYRRGVRPRLHRAARNPTRSFGRRSRTKSGKWPGWPNTIATLPEILATLMASASGGSFSPARMGSDTDASDLVSDSRRSPSMRETPSAAASGLVSLCLPLGSRGVRTLSEPLGSLSLAVATSSEHSHTPSRPVTVSQAQSRDRVPQRAQGHPVQA